MENRINFITIGTQDFDKMRTFYEDVLGWEKINSQEAIAFYKMNGFFLGLYSSHALAEDIGIEYSSSPFKQFTLAINFSSEEEVDEQFKILESKGIEIVKHPEKAFWGGYSGYFSDPENNYWEIAYNPFLEMDNVKNSVKHP